jgi:mono/diheme cytochrome c family protein
MINTTFKSLFSLKKIIYVVLVLGFVTAVAAPFTNSKKIIEPSVQAVAANTKIINPIVDKEKAQADKIREKESAEAFNEAYKVLMHPRCMNCHPSGDAPLQGDNSHIHAQNVTRGKDGKGVYAMKCSNCHQKENTPGLNMPPGDPEWHLPPANMKMVFQGKTPAQLAAQLKDPKQTGKTLQQMLKHVEEDHLVINSGWNPGEGRTKPPLSHAEFAAKFREWIEKGAVIPK